MQNAKSIPRKQYATIFIGVGIVLAILGVIFSFVLDAEKTFDLPWFIVGIGIAAVIYGIFQNCTGASPQPGSLLFDKNRKEFLDE